MLVNKFNIKTTDDWYRITQNQVREFFYIKQYKLMEIVKKFYPEIDLEKFQRFSNKMNKKSQYTLKNLLSSLFNQYEIIEEYRDKNLLGLELDYYIPALQLAFEYQVIFFLFFSIFSNFIFYLFFMFLILFFNFDFTFLFNFTFYFYLFNFFFFQLINK